MKRTITALTLVAAMLLLLAPAASAGAPPTASDAQERGYTCFTAGPDDWTHCVRAEQFGNKLVKVRIFSPAEFNEDGLIVAGGSVFLGSEDLVLDTAYDGRACPEDNLAVWDGPLGPDLDGDGEGDYFACHRFDTGRN